MFNLNSPQPMADGWFEFNIEAISSALGISEEDTEAYFTDGRRVSFLIERRHRDAMPGSTLAPSEGAGYDLVEANGGHWEVRSLTRGGIYFCPSYMVGAGRSFDEDGFREKLDDIEGYFVTDVTQFPNMPYWCITAEEVEEWWFDGTLGTTSKISYNKACELLD